MKTRPCSYHRAAVVLAPRIFQAFLGKLRIFSQGNLPGVVATVQIDCVERAPGWRNRRIARWIKKLVVPREAISGNPCHGLASCKLLTFSVEHILGNSADIRRTQIWKRRHSP